MSRFWTIPVLAVYVYAVTVLTYAGYSTYFGVPADFVQASIASNALFASFMLHALVNSFLVMSWKGWLVLTFYTTIFLGCSYVFLFRPMKALSALLVIPALWFAWQSLSFGEALAKGNVYFYMPEKGCVTGFDANQKLIAPAFYDSNAIFVPIDDSNKMTGGFMMKDLTQLPCKLTLQTVGKVTK
jgi:hypothetical protein